MITGVVFSLIVSVLFAVYAVPRKFSKQNAAPYKSYFNFGTRVKEV